MSYKRLTPCILIDGGKAVRWFDDKTVIAEDVVELARQYSEHGADELLIFDLSNSDEEHDMTIDLMKKINRVIGIPMVVGGNISRQEDVKKNSICGCKTCNVKYVKTNICRIIKRSVTAVWQTSYCCIYE